MIRSHVLICGGTGCTSSGSLKLQEAMNSELAAYGLVAGLMHKFLPKKKPYIYCSLLVAMIVGRLVWGAAMFVCMSINGGAFTFAAFVAGAFTNAIPGIIVQIVVIPVLVMVLESPKIKKIFK